MIIAIAEKLPPIRLTLEQADKVIAVAVAAIFTFGAGWALLFASLTFYFEGIVRSDSHENWTDSRQFSLNGFLTGMRDVFAGNLLIAIGWIALSALGRAFWPMGNYQTAVAEMASASPVRFFVKAVIQAPICEEILFRGFLQERFEDAAQLFHRHIYPLPREFQQKLANLAQAVLFGFAHITGNQVAVGAKGLIAMVTGWMGYVMGRCKIENGGLYTSISIHSTNNLIASAQLFLRA